MSPTERLILKNQMAIMRVLSGLVYEEDLLYRRADTLSRQIQETETVLAAHDYVAPKSDHCGFCDGPLPCLTHSQS